MALLWRQGHACIAMSRQCCSMASLSTESPEPSFVGRRTASPALHSQLNQASPLSRIAAPGQRRTACVSVRCSDDAVGVPRGPIPNSFVPLRVGSGGQLQRVLARGFFGFGGPKARTPDIVQAGDPVLHEPTKDVPVEVSRDCLICMVFELPITMLSSALELLTKTHSVNPIITCLPSLLHFPANPKRRDSAHH